MVITWQTVACTAIRGNTKLPKTPIRQSHLIWDVRVGTQKGYGLVVASTGHLNRAFGPDI
jgi:hypothetical protein